MAKVIEFQHFSKSFGGREVVSDLSFSVDEGTILGLLGKNGAGKSTSLRGLLGLVKPTGGTAQLFGREFTSLGFEAQKIGVSIEGVGSFPKATAVADLKIWCALLGLPNKRIDQVLEQVGMQEYPNMRIKRMSTGMRQRHVLAVAMLADPRVLILDEPTNGLDPEGIRWLRGFLRSRADDGVTVLLSSHMLAEVEQTVDEVVILQKTLRFYGSLKELTNDGARSLEDGFFDLVPSSEPQAKKGC